jgi:hypothetical protein
MRDQVKTAAICVLCRCGLDLNQPHAIVKHDYAHQDCADRYDARDLGSIDYPEDFRGIDESEDLERGDEPNEQEMTHGDYGD